ncbi:MAG: helix-turn-helix domain-containing protein [Pseudomonadales bacterium]|nr:helix-turn-helix domain-containing protein [Pseudomonadales bacterium]NRA16375.1 AraC family transcriptional regulator [Oceanospirillaceae bacterium]
MFSAYDVFLSIGIAQGVISSFIFFISKDKQVSIKVLGMAILLLCLVNFKYLLQVIKFYDIENSDFLPFHNILFLCPVAYFYVNSLVVENYKIDRTKIIHFIPGTLFLVYDLVVYFFVFDLIGQSEKIILASSLYYFHVNSFESYIVVVSSLFYFYLSIVKLIEYKVVMNVLKFDNTHPVYSWIRSVFIWCFFLIVFHLYNVLLEPFGRYSSVDIFRWNMFYMYVSVFIYYLGFMGYRQTDSNLDSSKASLESMNKKINALDVNRIKIQITEKLEIEKIYLNPTLSISEFALELSISTENLSFVINHEYNFSFRDLINSSRVNEAKEKLQQIQFSKQSILAVSLDSGFNSQASFYRAFKKFEGITPKEYISNCVS